MEQVIGIVIGAVAGIVITMAMVTAIVVVVFRRHYLLIPVSNYVLWKYLHVPDCSIPYSLIFSRGKYFMVLPNSAQKTNIIFVVKLPATHSILAS